jgi:multidrug efflux pump subunit AcrA (membrane-fusion protein)
MHGRLYHRIVQIPQWEAPLTPRCPARSPQVAAAEAQLAASDAELQASRSQSRALERQLQALELDLRAARQEATAAGSASAAAGDTLAEAQAALAAQRRANEGLQRDARAAGAKAAEAARQLQNRDGDVMVLCEAVRDVLVGVRSKYNHPFDWSLGGQGSAGGGPLQHLRQLVDVLAAEVASRHAELEKAGGEVGRLEAALQEKQELVRAHVELASNSMDNAASTAGSA